MKNIFWSLLFVLLVFVYSCLFFTKLSYPIFGADGDGYYSYLPALLINKDLQSLNPYDYETHRDYLPYPAFNLWEGTGKYLNKYPPGTAIFLLPMFLMASFISLVVGLPVDGYNDIFQYFVGLSAGIFLLLGLFLLYKIYQKRFSKKIIILSLLSLFLSTNLISYTAFNPIFSHIYSFFTISLSLYLILRWSLKPQSFLLSLFLGLSFGLNFLVRNTNILVLLFWLLFGVYSLGSAKQKIKLIVKNKKTAGLIFVTMIFVVSPQFLYYHLITGHWLVFSYFKEGFNFFNPAWYGVLFSPRRGLFFWAPILLISGLSVFDFKKYKDWFLAGLVYLFCQTYVIASWHQWWYGDAFGHRAFIDSFPIIALFFMSGLTFLFKRKLNFPAYLYISICSILNIYLMILYWFGKLPRDNITINSYLKIIMPLFQSVNLW